MWFDTIFIPSLSNQTIFICYQAIHTISYQITPYTNPYLYICWLSGGSSNHVTHSYDSVWHHIQHILQCISMIESISGCSHIWCQQRTSFMIPWLVLSQPIPGPVKKEAQFCDSLVSDLVSWFVHSQCISWPGSFSTEFTRMIGTSDMLCLYVSRQMCLCSFTATQVAGK